MYSIDLSVHTQSFYQKQNYKIHKVDLNTPLLFFQRFVFANAVKRGAATGIGD